MTMRSLSAAQIELYLDMVGDVALTTVGAYQAEGLGVHILEKYSRRSLDHTRSAFVRIALLLEARRGARVMSYPDRRRAHASPVGP